MSDEIGSYTFLPWLRGGLSNRIGSADGDAAVKLRPTIAVQLDVKARGLDGSESTTSYTRNVALYGPGDVIGIESRAIIQTEPRNWITNFEPNYLPYVAFYDEDFPWRYTPAAASTPLGRLRPWIALIVLKDGEFEEGRNIQGKPLPFVEVADATLFPAADELWAWAHVHVNRNLVGPAADPRSTDMAAVLPAFAGVLQANADLAYSRLISPRKLEPNTRYHAFVMPTFESGRLAGLQLDPDATPAEVHATFSAWATYTGREAPAQYPYYFRWVFRTGSEGDFEHLVRLLKPRPANARVGRRDMDVQRPGSNIDGITDPGLGGILKLPGALRVPVATMKETDRQEVLKYDNWAQPYPHAFQRDLAAFINLSDEYAVKEALAAHAGTDLDEAIKTDPDPLITPPIYGRWHALTNRLLEQRDGSAVPHADKWVHEMNLDPRWRVAGGFGTRVIQQNQEAYMDAAWGQIGQVLEANRLMRQAQLSAQVSRAWHVGIVTPLAARADDRLLMFAAPVHSRVMVDGVTAHYRLHESPVSRAATSVSMRRMLRPRARLMKYTAFDGAARPTNLLARINNREVSPAPPKLVPPELPTVDKIEDSLRPPAVPDWLWDLLRRYPWLAYVPYVLAAIVLIVAVLAGGAAAIAFGIALAGGLVYVGTVLQRTARLAAGVEAVKTDNQTPEQIDTMPTSPDFRIVPVSGASPGSLPVRTGGADSDESQRFKRALKDAYGTLRASRAAGRAPDRPPAPLATIAGATVAAIDPAVTIPRFVRHRLRIPERLLPDRPAPIEPVMAYPELDIPMYKPLSDLSTELLVPNLNLIEDNSITLLETNQKFIEAYMVGVNHEFARELLWREYPTDQRGSYFRQFWDVNALLGQDASNPEALRETLKDIPPIHTWRPDSKLGDHDHREAQRENEEELVLVIRGELLKKYPNAVIYAHRARWQRKPDGTIDNTKERRLEDAAPVTSHVKTPLYEAKVEPDIYFFGFDLDAVEARGGAGDDETDEPGWFFVIQERPGEPRFGFDVERTGALHVWNDLAWTDILANPAAGGFVRINASTPTFTLAEPVASDVQEKRVQWEEDRFLQWHRDMDAATAAYILFQAPVMVAVHAAEMLPKAET